MHHSGGDRGEVSGGHTPGLVTGPDVDAALQAEKDVVGGFVEVEADRRGVRAPRGDDGEGVGGFFPRHEEAGGRQRAGDVDDFAGEGGEHVRGSGGAWGAGEGCERHGGRLMG